MCGINRYLLSVPSILLLLLSAQSIVVATEGDPIAIRRWSGGTVSLETHWGLRLAIHPSKESSKQFSQEVDQELISSESVDHLLFRVPNKTKPSWLPASEVSQVDVNAIKVESVRFGLDGARSLTLEVDGIRILVVPLDALGTQQEFDAKNTKEADILILSTGKHTRLIEPSLISFIKSISPNLVLINPVETAYPRDIEQLRSAIKAEDEILTIDHNTLAVSQTIRALAKPQIVKLDESPWEMPNELENLFSAMEQANSDSQKVFAKLSTNQMNFKPANGTHTPRWNSEHMMGRQLLFFSQIYHAQNPSIPVMDLNPKQMPPDYVFAHPDWDGREEARQMQRVSEFTRRFSYLLTDIDLDKKAPGSDWPSLRALLNQMHRHYSEHTANTVKKYDLPGWPKK